MNSRLNDVVEVYCPICDEDAKLYLNYSAPHTHCPRHPNARIVIQETTHGHRIAVCSVDEDDELAKDEGRIDSAILECPTEGHTGPVSGYHASLILIRCLRES